MIVAFSNHYSIEQFCFLVFFSTINLFFFFQSNSIFVTGHLNTSKEWLYQITRYFREELIYQVVIANLLHNQSNGYSYDLTLPHE